MCGSCAGPSGTGLPVLSPTPLLPALAGALDKGTLPSLLAYDQLHSAVAALAPGAAPAAAVAGGTITFSGPGGSLSGTATLLATLAPACDHSAADAAADAAHSHEARIAWGTAAQAAALAALAPAAAPVALGGAGLDVLAHEIAAAAAGLDTPPRDVMRAYWFLPAAPASANGHTHTHSNGHAHDHAHGDCTHDHDQAHDHTPAAPDALALYLVDTALPPPPLMQMQMALPRVLADAVPPARVHAGLVRLCAARGWELEDTPATAAAPASERLSDGRVAITLEFERGAFAGLFGGPA